MRKMLFVDPRLVKSEDKIDGINTENIKDAYGLAWMKESSDNFNTGTDYDIYGLFNSDKPIKGNNLTCGVKLIKPIKFKEQNENKE